MAKTEESKREAFALPEGRIMHHSLFVKDAYEDEATPMYKVELLFEKDSDAAAEIEDALLDAADAHWPPEPTQKGSDPVLMSEDEDLVLPILDGDKLAKKRERKGKDGSAYKGNIVVRAKTKFNKDGQDGPGGVQVYDANVEPIEPVRASEIYSGCYGELAVTIGFYENPEGNPAMTFYIAAFQKTKDGDPLISTDRSNLFKPVSGGDKRKNRRSRE